MAGRENDGFSARLPGELVRIGGSGGSANGIVDIVTFVETLGKGGRGGGGPRVQVEAAAG
jgi:hypothetical protein